MNRLFLVGTHLGALLVGVLLMNSVQQGAVPPKSAKQGAILTTEIPKLSGSSKSRPPSHTSDHWSLSGEQAVHEIDNFKVKTQQNLLDRSSSDPIEALSWLFSEEQEALRFKMAYPFERMDTVRRIFAAMPSHQLSAALEFISSKNDDGLFIAALCAVASGEHPTLSREAILGNLPSYTTNDAMREQLRNSLLSEWANSEPQSAQAWALQERNSDIRDSAILAVAETLLKSDPVAAIRWANDNISSNLWPSVFASLVASWIEHDPPSVAIWLQQQSPSQELDRALDVFALKMRNIDTGTALHLSSQITGKNLR